LRKLAMKLFLKTTGTLNVAVFHATNTTGPGVGAGVFPRQEVMVASNLRTLPPAAVRSVSEQRPLSLLFLGRISPVKGLHNAIAAAARLPHPVTLTICGPVHDEAYWESCKRQLVELPAHVRVEIVGAVDNSEAMRRYAMADLFLNPSASENFGHTIFEALAAGTPVITGTKTPWNGLEADRAGYNVPSDQPLEIASAIEAFYRLSQSEMLDWRSSARARASTQANDPATVHIWHRWLTSGLSHVTPAISCPE